MFRLNRWVVSLAVFLAVGLVVACSDATGPSTAGSAQAEMLLAGPQLARCAPQPDAQVSAWIGPEGGSIKAGKHELKFARGSLGAPTLITMHVPSDTVNSVVFGPEGLRFPDLLRPTLKMNYKNCRVPSLALKKIVYTSDNQEIEETLLTVDDVLTGDVAARLKHFSRYSIAY